MYSFVKEHIGSVYVTEYNDKKQVWEHKIYRHKPYIFIKAQNGEYTTLIQKQRATKVEYENAYELKDALNKYGNLVCGNINYISEHQVIRDKELYKNIKTDAAKRWYLDIECPMKEGFPDPKNVFAPIVSITVIERQFNNKKTIVWTTLNVKQTESIRVFEDEVTMLQDFIFTCCNSAPQLIFAHNGDGFDFPYISNRMKVLGLDLSLASPFKKIAYKSVDVTFFKKEFIEIPVIYGIQLIDFMKLEAFMTNSNKQSLKKIAKKYGVPGKIEHEDTNLYEFMLINPERFIEYNIQDCEIMENIDTNIRFFDRLFFLSHETRMVFEKFDKFVLPIEIYSYNYLLDQNIVWENNAKDLMKYEGMPEIVTGGYVMDAVEGVYDWVSNLDVNSEYPNTIIRCNISPETKVPWKIIANNPELMKIHDSVDEYRMLNREIDLSCLKKYNYCVTANGVFFDRSKQGMFPTIADKWYSMRAQLKKELFEVKTKLKTDKNNEHLINLAREKNGLIWTMKILLNACLYGAFNNKGFIFGDLDLANAITSSSRLTVHEAEKAVNEFMAQFGEKKGVIYMDTDSTYFTCAKFIEKMVEKKPDLTFKDKINLIIKLVDEKLNKVVIENAFQRMMEYENGMKQTMKMKREIVGDKMIFGQSKKRYAIRIYADDSFSFDEPKLKVKGFEIIKEEIPEKIKQFMEKAFYYMFDKIPLKKLFDEAWQIYKNFDYKEIALLKGVEKLDEYEDYSVNKNRLDAWKPKCNPPTKGVITYNRYLEKRGLLSKYPKIQNGNKVNVLYLKPNNVFGPDIEVISFMTSIPEEFGLTKDMIDYDKMFQKSFIQPIMNIAETNPDVVINIPVREKFRLKR